MIPLKVTVENFLTYASPAVEFDFDGEPLWILCGPNGTGKSAVFDAITYALFGCFRGSDRRGNRAEELIHHDATWFRVEFEFEFGGIDYRISRRKTTKGQPKIGVARRTCRNLGENGWEPLENVNGVRELDVWVSETLGLSFNTFVCSVLLRQGKAEEIIDAERDTRLKVLHGIIDFGRYVDLHKRVADDTTTLTRDVKALHARLAGIPEITDQDLSDAKDHRDAADDAWTKARDAHRAAQVTLGHARTWELLQQQMNVIQADLAVAAKRDARAATIESQMRRLRELREVVPILSSVLRLRKTIGTTAGQSEELSGKLEVAMSHKDAVAASVEQERQKGERHREAIAELDRQIPEADALVKETGQHIKRAQDMAQLTKELLALDGAIREFPTNLDEHIDAAETRLRAARGARDALPHLEAIVEAKANHLAAVGAGKEAAALEASASTKALELAGKIRIAEEEKTKADKAQREAERKKAETNIRLTDAKARLKKFRTVAGAMVCSECGQAIDAKHVESELAKFDSDISTAKKTLKECSDAVEIANKELTSAGDAWTALQEQHRDRDREKAEAVQSKERAAGRQREATTAFERAKRKLAESYRLLLPGIDIAGFPVGDDIDEASRLSESVDSTHDEVQSLKETKHSLALKKTERGEKQTALDRLGVEPVSGASSEELVRLEGELTRLRDSRKTESTAYQKALSEEKRLAGDLKNAGTEETRLTGELANVNAAHGAAKSQLVSERERLPEEWVTVADTVADQQVQGWANERDGLDESGIEDEETALTNDRALKASREQQAAELQEQIGQLPEDSRRAVALVKADVSAAEHAETTAEGNRTRAVQQFNDLTRRHGDRKTLEHELAETGRSRDLHDKLAGLLGKAGLQRDLVRDAERDIVDLANETLFRVSNGDLRLERPAAAGAEDDDAVFDLSVRQAGVSNPVGLAFLSGSQRFRVAVALALAVGRFASRQARPLEAVIIDEGFGCLDTTGRVGMIEELQRLQRPGDLPNPLKRIILVSHHQDFSDAFPVGYELSNINGTTEAKVFRK